MGGAWSVAILPYIDQASLFNQFNFNTNPYQCVACASSPAGNQALVATVLPAFNCPTDMRPLITANNPGTGSANALAGKGANAVSISSYMGCAGPFDGTPCVQNGTVPVPEVRNIGLFQVNSSVRIRDITDGTTNVFAVGEVRWIPETPRLDEYGPTGPTVSLFTVT